MTRCVLITHRLHPRLGYGLMWKIKKYLFRRVGRAPSAALYHDASGQGRRTVSALRRGTDCDGRADHPAAAPAFREGHEMTVLEGCGSGKILLMGNQEVRGREIRGGVGEPDDPDFPAARRRHGHLTAIAAGE